MTAYPAERWQFITAILAGVYFESWMPVPLKDVGTLPLIEKERRLVSERRYRVLTVASHPVQYSTPIDRTFALEAA